MFLGGDCMGHPLHGSAQSDIHLRTVKWQQSHCDGDQCDSPVLSGFLHSSPSGLWALHLDLPCLSCNSPWDSWWQHGEDKRKALSVRSTDLLKPSTSPLRPALKPEQYVLHTPSGEPWPLHCSIWESWPSQASAAVASIPLASLFCSHISSIYEERKGWLAGCFPALCLVCWIQSSRELWLTRAPGPAPPLGLELSTDSTFWLQHSSDCHLHASQAHGELGHPGQAECVIRDDGVISNPHETSLASTCSRNQI